MLRKLYLVLTFIIVGSSLVVAQTGALKVTVVDKVTNEPIPFAGVAVLSGGSQVSGGSTDMNGVCIIKPLNPGKYDVKVVEVGYQPSEVSGALVAADQTQYVTVKLGKGAGVNLKTVHITHFKVPLINKNTEVGQTIDRQDYNKLAVKSVTSVAAMAGGTYQADQGKAINIRGARSDATAYYVDGVKVIGSSALPESSIEQISVITGGVPAKYGDVTGGVINVTTRGPQRNYFFGIDGKTSELLDPYGYNQLDFSVGGPILTKKDSLGNVTKSLLGFIVSGEVKYQKDPSPAANGIWALNSSTLDSLQQYPLRPAPTGGSFRNSEFVTSSDMKKVKAKPNSARMDYMLNGKLDFQPSQNLTVTLGGSDEYSNRHDFVYVYSLFNAVNNPQYIDNTWRAYAKLTQHFGSQTQSKDKKSSDAVVKNAFYTLQASYSQFKETNQDDSYKNNLFDYGYIGKFTQYQSPTYQYKAANGSHPAGYYMTGYADSLLTFTPGDVNPYGANYTSQYYSFVGADNVVNGVQVQQGLGLLNGDRPSNVYSLWYNTGRQWNGYSIINDGQFRVTADFSADIKDHAVEAGFDYEQETDRYFSINPIGLWTLMRQITNTQITQLDTANPIQLTGTGTYDYFAYNRKYNANEQSQFDKSLREKLGLPVNSTDWLDVDSYDPSMYSLSMFSADDLLNGGSSLVSYYGYDYTGKKLTSNPTFSDFLTKKDSRGDLARNIGAFQPIYIAGYVQDKFDFKDLKFNVGVRIDRYDANEKVLKDKYLMYPAKTAGEIPANSPLGTVPSDIGNNYVVYVNDVNNPTSIVGFRNNDTWYNAQGTEIADPTIIAQATTNGKIAPYLEDPNNQTLTMDAFKSYNPQINVMPRIAFSFPISDVANFFAHYDILTQRPGGNPYNPYYINRLDPTQYLYLQYGSVINNPDLKPERTTDYELGFSQILSQRKNSAITLSAFYRELRNMIQVVNVNEAYPITYITYGNIDFGTVKGFTASYDLRRTGNVELKTSYTLQFANGTGSSASDGYNLVSSGLPNLRTTIPLSYDQRHTITTDVDYHYSSGEDYNGPVITLHKGKDGEKTLQILANAGANLSISAGSGTPYTRQSNITEGDPSTQNVGIGISQRSTLKGSINGSNLPWQYRLDLKVDKSVQLTWGGKKSADSKEVSGKKKANLNIYLEVLNLLNTKNILNVYHATGNPTDDGFLSSPLGQQTIAAQTNPQSFIDLYEAKVTDPTYYTLPRRMRIGFTLDF